MGFAKLGPSLPGTQVLPGELLRQGHDRKEADMFSDMMMPIFEWWTLLALASVALAA